MILKCSQNGIILPFQKFEYDTSWIIEEINYNPCNESKRLYKTVNGAMRQVSQSLVMIILELKSLPLDGAQKYCALENSWMVPRPKSECRSRLLNGWCPLAVLHPAPCCWTLGRRATLPWFKFPIGKIWSPTRNTKFSLILVFALRELHSYTL